jgi:integrase
MTGRKPEFGPIKTDMPRVVDLAPETVTLLRDHKRHQAELKMANRTVYQDLGLAFAKEWGHLHGSAGFTRPTDSIEQYGATRVWPIAEGRQCPGHHHHGLRHTSATLLLNAGVPAQLVQQRLGHKRIEITLENVTDPTRVMSPVCSVRTAPSAGGPSRKFKILR